MTMTFRSTITSNQRAFNAVCRHLAKQQHRARTRLTAHTNNPDHHAAYACEYINPSGDRCAIGALLTLDSAKYAEYHYSGEGITSIAAYIHPSPADLGLSEELLEQLQTAHDQSDTLDLLRTALRDIAENWNLNPAAISEITRWEGSL